SFGLVELASLIPQSAGEYVYLRMSYAHWVGFLFAWTVGFLIKPSGQAVIAITSAQNIPLTLYIAMPLVTILYVFANISYFTVMDSDELLESAAVAVGILAIFYVLAGDVITLMDFMGFATWLFIGFIQLSVIILRVKMKDAPRTYKVPIVFPGILFLFSMALVIVPLVTSPQIEFLYATLVILAGLLFYIPIVVLDHRPSCMSEYKRGLYN
ncbi:hypothetical protein LSH36_37g05028, partial [Paralvinella palmiformis]